MADIPKIRFKGFTEPWEQRKLGEVGTTYTGLSGKTADDFGHGEASFITYMNVFSHPVANSEMVEHVEIDNKQREVQVGDVFFTTSSETPEEVGMSSVLKEKHGVTYLNSFCFGFRPNVKFDLDYLAYMLRSEPTRSQIKILAQGISRFNISKNKMMDINIQVPNLEEQAMVGAYFRNLDHLITLHQRKCDDTKELKKYMLQKMFPKNGEKFPEIRFKGFTEAWEQRKLGDIITEYKETVDSDCTLPILTSSKTEGVILQEEHFGRKQQHDITGYNILPRNYCTYRNRSDGVDFTFNINKCCDKGIISKFYPVFSGKNSDVFFLSLVLNNSEEVVREIAYTCTGTGQKVLSFLDLQKMKVRVPNFDEQKEIAAYFESLDHLITLHQRKYFIIYNKLITWEQRKLGEVLKERTERAKGDEELLSVTIANGVIRQIDSEKRNTASEDRSNYKIVKKGDVPYNSMRMWQGAVGNSKYNGIVSPAYTILTPTSEANGKFFMELFKKKSTLQIFQRWSQGLTSDTWNLKYPILSSIQFAIPSVEEQEKIAEYFSSLDHLITLHRRAL